MIKSTNIDLTENRDFGERFSFDTPLNIQLSARELNYVNGLYTNDRMSYEEYKLIKKYETIFGKIKHHDASDKVFDKDRRFNEEIEEHCYRCGKHLRIPWLKRQGLCKECNEDMDEKEQLVSNVVDVLQRCPWHKYKELTDSREILQLR